MVRYTIIVKNQGDNQQYSYSLELNLDQEDNPHLLGNTEITSAMQRQLEQKSTTKITDSQLKQIINTWIEDIKEGYRNTTIVLNLRSAFEEKLNLLKDQGNQELPHLVEPDLENIEPLGGMLPPLESILIN